MSSDSHTPKIFLTILSNVNPLSMPLPSGEGENDLILSRWRAVFGSFSFWHTCSEESLKKSEGYDKTDCKKFLENECSRTTILQKFEKPLTEQLFPPTRNRTSPSESILLSDPTSSSESTPLSIEDVRHTLLHVGQAYYEEIWATLTLNEQLALFHLARDRFIHVGHPGLDPLFRKGLIRFDPDLRIINTSFREYVLQVGDRDNLANQEAKQGQSLWDSLKIPLGLGFTIVIGVLLLTQEELRAALPAVFAAFPFLFQGLSDFTKTKKLTP